MVVLFLIAMKIGFKVGFALAFVPLVFLMGETHELVHTSVGRLICGCWGVRDFNVWGLCEGCAESYPVLSVMATFAGPAYSFLLVWLGYWLLGKEKPVEAKAWGMSLIASNILFARMLTAALSGGDEVHGLRKLLESNYLAWVLGALVVFVLSIPPLVRVYRTIENDRRWLWFIGFLLVPFLIAMVGAIVLNGLLGAGVLADTWILGSPMLVSVWTLVVVVGFALTWRNIPQLSL